MPAFLSEHEVLTPPYLYGSHQSTIVQLKCDESDFMNTNMFPNFGDLHDNASAFQIALYEIKHGDKAWGYEVLVKLRDHIERTMEIESIQWLLPEVLTAIKELDTPGLIPNTSESLNQATQHWHTDSTRMHAIPVCPGHRVSESRVE